MDGMETVPAGVATTCAHEAGDAAESGSGERVGQTGGAGKRGVRGRGIRWTKTMKEAFLDHLAATCHVSGAAASIGVGLTTMYTLRRRDEAFAAEWSRALLLGYQMLETQVVGHALTGGGRRTIGDDDGMRNAGIDIELALLLLTTHRNAMLGKPFKGGRQPTFATREETNVLILKKLRVVEERNSRRALPAPTPAPEPEPEPEPEVDAGQDDR